MINKKNRNKYEKQGLSTFSRHNQYAMVKKS